MLPARDARTRHPAGWRVGGQGKQEESSHEDVLLWAQATILAAQADSRLWVGITFLSPEVN